MEIDRGQPLFCACGIDPEQIERAKQYCRDKHLSPADVAIMTDKQNDLVIVRARKNFFFGKVKS